MKTGDVEFGGSKVVGHTGIVILVGLMLVSCKGVTGPYGTKPEREETRHVIQFVHAAADEIAKKGADAFPEFRETGSRWYSGDTYAFVTDMSGKMLMHPIRRDLEGRDVRSLRDADGRPFVQRFLAIVNGPEGQGWSHYRWPKPGATEPSWKSSFVMRVTGPNGEQYCVGSGIYDAAVERMFAVDLVQQAVALIDDQGSAALPTLQSRTSGFSFQDYYVFAFDEDGIERVSPAQPELVGHSVLDLKSADGKVSSREMMKMLETKDAGWVDYMWAKPGTTRQVRKSSYVTKTKLGDKTLYVGCGVYLD